VFDFTWGELLVIAVVALIVIGPKELPAVLRTIGQWTTKIRRMAAEFQGQFQEAMREAEMADLKKEVDEAARGFTSQFDDPLNLKEATKWEPKPDAAKPDDAAKGDSKWDSKSDETFRPAEIAKSDEAFKPDEATKLADTSQQTALITPEPSAHHPHAEEVREAGADGAPVATEHAATGQTPSLHSPAGGRGNGGGATDAPATPVTPPLDQPPPPYPPPLAGEGREGAEESSPSGSAGGVHS